MTPEQLDSIRQRAEAANHAGLTGYSCDPLPLLAEIDRLNAELAKLSRESARLLADYGARGMTIERLNAQMTEVSLVARRTADENDRLKAALASCVSDLRNAGYRLIEDARVLVAAVDALPSSSDGAGQTDEAAPTAAGVKATASAHMAEWRRQLLTALGREDDGKTISYYIGVLAGERDKARWQRDDARARVHFGHSGRYESCLRLPCKVDRLNAELADAKNELKATQNARLLSVVFGHHKGAPKPFVLQRRNGHAVVALGAEFPDGAVALRLANDGGWTTSSEGSAEHFLDDSTEIVWLSDELESLAEMEQQRDRAVAELAEARLELDARDRYQEALAIGLSDYEAREEGWPTAATPSSSDGATDTESSQADVTAAVAHAVDAGSRYAARDAVVEAAKVWRGNKHAGINLPPAGEQITALIAAVDALPSAGEQIDSSSVYAADSSSDGVRQTGCPNCDGLDGTHTLRSCLAMADVERYRSFVAPGFDCPECLVDTGDSAHMVSCSIGRRLGCATRTDGAGQTDEAISYLVVAVQIHGSPENWCYSYSNPLHLPFTDRAEANRIGEQELGHDDFCIGTLHAGKLVAYGPGMRDFGPGERDDLSEIARQLGVRLHPAAASVSAPAEEKA